MTAREQLFGSRVHGTYINTASLEVIFEIPKIASRKRSI